MSTEPHNPISPGDMFLVMADLITFRVTDAASSGRVTVVEIHVPAGGGPPPLHVHPPDEVFHVIEGEMTIFTGDPENARRTLLRSGDTEHVPGGTPHTFRNFSEVAVPSAGRVLPRGDDGEVLRVRGSPSNGSELAARA